MRGAAPGLAHLAWTGRQEQFAREVCHPVTLAVAIGPWPWQFDLGRGSWTLGQPGHFEWQQQDGGLPSGQGALKAAIPRALVLQVCGKVVGGRSGGWP